MSWRFGRLLVFAVAATACGGEDFTAGGGAGGSAGAGGGGTAGGGGSGGSAAAIAIVQATHIEHESGEDVPTMTWPVAPTPGNAIIVGISCFSEVDNCTIAAGGVTDNQGNTYAVAAEGYAVASSDTHGVRPYVFVAEAIAVASDPFIISVDPNGSAADNQSLTWGAIEVFGLAAAPSLDQTGYTIPTVADATTVDTEGPTSQANGLAVAVLADRTSGDAAIAEDPTWTEHHVNQTDALGLPHSMVTKVLSTAEVVSHTWTHAVPTRGTVSVIATFEAELQE